MPASQPGPAAETISARLLQGLLGEADQIAADAHALLAPMGQARDTIRARLEANNQILQIADTATPVTLAAVDGGSVTEPLYAADLLVVVAASAAGMATPVPGPELHHDHWTRILTHHTDNGKLIGAAMAALELRMLNRLSHDLRILDGSTTSAIIALSVGLTAHSADVADHVADLIDDDLLAAIYALGDHTRLNYPGTIVALPKSDSSTYYHDLLDDGLPAPLLGNDKFLAATILEPGEMLYPRLAGEHGHPPASIPKGASGPIQDAAHALAEAGEPIRRAVDENRLVVTYLKPETSDTAIKAEILLTDPIGGFSDPTPDAAGIAQVRRIGRIISDETPGPFLQEPFAQYAVDLAAKSVSVGAEALNQAMLARLPEGAESYLNLLARSYRTSGPTGGPSRPGALTPRPGPR